MRMWKLLGVFLLALFFTGCSGAKDANAWADKTLGAEAAAKLLQEVQNKRAIGGSSEPYLARPFVLIEARLDHPDITQVKEHVFHVLNETTPGVASSANEAKTLVVISENYKFLPNADGKSERAERDGTLLRMLDRKEGTFTSLKIPESTPEAIRASLNGLPETP